VELARRAHAVLEGNWLGAATRPGPRLYPHQWSWDSAFHAIGWSHLDWDRATTELRTLFAAQWPDGLLPHIVFHDGAAAYFPGPDVSATPRGNTSGIVQPPLHATAAWLVARRAPSPEAARAFVGELFGPPARVALVGARGFREYYALRRARGWGPSGSRGQPRSCSTCWRCKPRCNPTCTVGYHPQRLRLRPARQRGSSCVWGSGARSASR
jgi:Mannosylglycerate hydrolase MGH1-like glycoside hydrolase domain